MGDWVVDTANSRQVRLIVFDVEGVLIPKNRFIFELSKSLGPMNLLRVLLIGFLYEARLLQLESALKRIFKMMQGIEVEKLLEIAERVPIMPEVRETISILKSQGKKIAIVSSGLPGLIVNYLADKIKAEYAFGFELGLESGKLNGEIWGKVIQHDGKYQILCQILSTEKLTPSDCAVVADDRNNLPMFRSGILKIAYNPDFIIRIKADKVVNGTLGKILPIVMGQPLKPSLPSRNDLRREAIHFSAISIPILVMLIGLNWVIFLISVIVLFYVISELYRMEGKKLPIFSRITGLAASETELYGFAAAPIYFAVGILLTLILFPTPVNSAAIAIFAVGDSSASLLGGLSKIQNPLNKGKTLEGSIAGFLLAFLAGAIFITPWKALLGAMIAMTIEALPLPLNDNITIPFFAGIGMIFL